MDLQNTFLELGYYNSGIGDLVVPAFTDILGVPIVVISSSAEMDVSIHFPQNKILSGKAIYLAHNVEGHYDATDELSNYSHREKILKGSRCGTILFLF